jgi:hypothetical protein
VVGRRFEQTGMLFWHCTQCKAEGVKSFSKLSTEGPDPLIEEYVPVLIEAEIEHALSGCKGSLNSEGAKRDKAVEFVKNDQCETALRTQRPEKPKHEKLW